jgi:hypothetical protein
VAGIFDDIVSGSGPAPAQAAPANMFADIVGAQPVQGAVPPPITTGNLTQGPGPSLGERAYTAADNAFQGTLLGAGANAVGSVLGINPAPLANPYTGASIPGSYQSPAQNYANEPAATGVLGQAATVLGTVAGGAASPESFVAGPEGYGAVRAGEALLPTVLKTAGTQAGVQGGANAAAQGINIATGEQTGGFDVPQVLESAGVGAVIGAAAPAAGAVVNTIKGVEAPGAGLFDDIVHAGDEPGAAPATSAAQPTGMFDDIVQSGTQPEELAANAQPAPAPSETAEAPVLQSPATTPSTQPVPQPPAETGAAPGQSPAPDAAGSTIVPADSGSANGSVSALAPASGQEVPGTQVAPNAAVAAPQALPVSQSPDEFPFPGDTETPPQAAPGPTSQPASAGVNPPPGMPSLVSFLTSRGGISDPGGDLRAMGAQGQRVGLLRTTGGQSLDYAREAAEEAGYLSPGSDINDLRNAISTELQGRLVYPPEHQAALDAYAQTQREADQTRVQAQSDAEDEAFMGARETVQMAADDKGVHLTPAQVDEAATLHMQGMHEDDAVDNVAQPAAPSGGTMMADSAARIGAPDTGHFNKGTSPYVQVFRDAGHDPDVATSLPIHQQNQIIRAHIAKTFGLKDIDVSPRQDPKEVRDQLSNFYQNGREMSAALGMPHKAIGLDGEVSLSTKPFNANAKYLGSYRPADKTIMLPGRSNSFAHEWTHALDHHLSQELSGNPGSQKMLSRAASTAHGAPGGKVPMPGSPADGFAGVLRAIYGKDAADAAEALKLQYVARGRDKQTAFFAGERLKDIQSNFVTKAKDMGRMSKYYSDPAELLARSHEAFIADAIKRQGGDTRAIAKPKYSDVSENFDKLYPQEDDRARIFQAYRDMHDAMRREEILGDHAGQRPDGQDILDPTQWHKMADTKAEPGLTAALRREAQAFRNMRGQMRERAGFDPTAADPGRLGFKTRTGDVMANLVATARTVGNRLAKRQPEGAARDAFQEVMDKLTPAEHVRTAAQAAHHEIGPVFEEDVRAHSRANINKFTNILDAHKLGAMSAEHELMLRHILTEGDKPFTDASGKGATIPANIKGAAGKVRYLLDQEWERNKDAITNSNLPEAQKDEEIAKLGYARSGYFPRIYDDHKIYGDGQGFKTQAEKLHSIMFDRDVGNDPEKLLAAHDRMSAVARDGLEPDTRDGMNALRKNLKSQDKLTSQIEMAAAAEKPNLQTKLDALKSEAGALHDQLRSPVQDAYAKAAANEWFTRINSGDPTDFDTRGPNSAYTNKRVLPPEADEIMRDYMVNRPTEALPNYFQASARKIAFTKRFGAGGKHLDALMDRATAGGARGEDIAALRRLVETITGRQKSGVAPPVEHALNAVHAMGSISLMPRAMWSSLSEPMSMLIRTGNTKATYEAFANQVGDIARTANSKQRAEMANALGITISHLHDSIINDRVNAHYADSPRLSKLMTNFYKRSGLTALTNSQRRSVMAAGHTALGAWARDVDGSSPRLARDGAAQLRELGVSDTNMGAFTAFMKAHPGLPALKALETPEGQLWGHVVSRLTDKVIQDPGKVDKPLLSQSPVGRLGFGLMSFNYSWYHNVMEHFIETHTARVKEGFKNEGIPGGLSALGRAGAHAGVSAAAVFAASLAASTLRERLFNGESWSDHEKKGDLGSWLSDLAIQRTGINGPLDPIIQAMSGLKYQRDLSALVAGAQTGYFTQAAGNILKAFVSPSPDTNTSDYNAIEGAWQLLGVPAMATLFSTLPGGPAAGAIWGGAMQYLTGQDVGDKIASSLVGPKGTGVGGTPPPGSADAQDDGELDPTNNELTPQTKSNGSSSSGVPWGLADDVAAPGARVALPLLSRLPGPLKLMGLGGAGALAMTGLAREFGRFARNNDGE